MLETWVQSLAWEDLLEKGEVTASAVHELGTCRCISLVLRKGQGTRDQIANIHWIIEKAGNFRKTSTSN